MTPAPTGYALARARERIVQLLADNGVRISADEVRDVEPGIDAHLAVPLHRSAKQAGSKPDQLAAELGRRIGLPGPPFEQALPVRGYLNFRLNPAQFCAEVISDFSRAPGAYASSDLGKDRTVVIDYSSPNVAKPFSVGHLRSTVIGQALHNILSWLGYQAVGDNHLGDWGTQFGKLLCAFDLWGDQAELDRSATAHLLDLYVRFHDQAETDPELAAKARDWFRRLEAGDHQARQFWQRFVRLSTAEFQRIYDSLGVRFDQTLGESFYADRLETLVQRCLDKDIAVRERPPGPDKAGVPAEEDLAKDETVVLIPLEDQGIDTPLILQKSDGTSLYATREIATVEYRVQTWNPDKILYVVGNEQKLHFRQLNAALRLLGIDTPCVHVNFGLIRLPEGRMSTRKGRVVLLEDVISEAIARARAILVDREMSEPEKDQVARIVGIGAVKYADLAQNRAKDIVFDWNRMLSLDGDSAPYLLYAHTRCRSILRKAGFDEPDASFDPGLLSGHEEFELVRHIARFPDCVVSAASAYEPHRIANQLYRTAQDFSLFYNKVPVLQAHTPELRRARLFLVLMTAQVLKTGLDLLGIQVPEKM